MWYTYVQISLSLKVSKAAHQFDHPICINPFCRLEFELSLYEFNLNHVWLNPFCFYSNFGLIDSNNRVLFRGNVEDLQVTAIQTNTTAVQMTSNKFILDGFFFLAYNQNNCLKKKLTEKIKKTQLLILSFKLVQNDTWFFFP